MACQPNGGQLGEPTLPKRSR